MKEKWQRHDKTNKYNERYTKRNRGRRQKATEENKCQIEEAKNRRQKQTTTERTTTRTNTTTVASVCSRLVGTIG